MPLEGQYNAREISPGRTFYWGVAAPRQPPKKLCLAYRGIRTYVLFFVKTNRLTVRGSQFSTHNPVM